MSVNITLLARIMYPHLYQPKAWQNEEGEPKYECVLVIDSKDPQIQTIVYETAKIIAADLDGAQPSQDNYPLKPDTKNPLLAGCYTIRARSKFQPQVVDPQRKAILDPNVPADGDWVYASIQLYSYTKPRQGVAASLNGVMFHGPGQQKLGTGGGPSVDEMFGHVPQQAASTTTVAAPAQPQQNQPPGGFPY